MSTESASPGEKGTGGGDGGMGQRMDQIGQDAQRMWSDAQEAVQDFKERLDIPGRVERHPYGTLLAAAGIGYVLGGGLFTPLTARMVRLAFKLAALPFVKDELVGMAESAVDGFVQGARARAEAPEGGPEGEAV